MEGQSSTFTFVLQNPDLRGLFLPFVKERGGVSTVVVYKDLKAYSTLALNGSHLPLSLLRYCSVLFFLSVDSHFAIEEQRKKLANAIYSKHFTDPPQKPYLARVRHLLLFLLLFLRLFLLKLLLLFLLFFCLVYCCSSLPSSTHSHPHPHHHSIPSVLPSSTPFLTPLSPLPSNRR